MSAPVAGHRVQVRWKDLDGLGHVNNAVVLTYLEEGRDAFLEACGINRDQYVVGRCSITFLAEIDPSHGDVVVTCVVEEVGRSSLRTRESILATDGGVIVEAEFGLVLWDSETRGSRPITDRERAELTRRSEEVLA